MVRSGMDRSYLPPPLLVLLVPTVRPASLGPQPQNRVATKNIGFIGRTLANSCRTVERFDHRVVQERAEELDAIVGARRMYPIRKENDGAATRRIQPHRAAGEAEVAHAVARPAGAGGGIRRRRAVPAEAPGGPWDAGRRPVGVRRLAEERVDEGGHVARVAEQAGVSGDAAHGAGVLVVDDAADVFAGGASLGRPGPE